MAVLDVPPGGPEFSLVQRNRATRLYEAGRVKAGAGTGAAAAPRSSAAALFKVKDDKTWSVKLSGVEGDWGGSCTCPEGKRAGACPHLLAAAWTSWEPGSKGEDAIWRTALAPAEAALAKAPVVSRSGASEARLVLVLLAREEQALQVELRAKTRRKDGKWGAPRRLPVDHEGFGEKLVPHERALLQRLEGARAPHEPGLLRAGTVGLALSPALAEELLPAFGRSGCLAMEEEAGGRVVELVSDDDEPWRHAFRIEEQEGLLVLEAFLRRGEETRPLTDGDRLIPRYPLAMIDGKLHRRHISNEIEELVAAARAGNVRAPKRQAKAFVAAIAALAGEALEESSGVRWDEDGEAPRPLLFVSGVAESKGPAHLFDCRLACVYGTQEVTLFEAGPKAVMGSDGSLRMRDRRAEERLHRIFLMAGGEPGKEAGGLRSAAAVRNGCVHQGIFPRLVRRLHGAGWVILANGVVMRSPSRWRLSVSSGQDWFDLAGGLEFGGTLVPVPEILEAARDREGMVRLGDGRVGLLPERWLSRLRTLDLGEDNGEGALRFKDTQAFLFEALFSERELEVELEADAGFEELRSRLAGFQRMEPRHEPEGFQGTLRPYQRIGLGWLGTLRELGIGGCLADEMGLGKTVQILAHILVSRDADPSRRQPVLVVAPRSLAFQWIAETARFTPELTILDHRGSTRVVSAANFGRYDIIVTTYGTLRRDAAALAKIPFSTVVLDEATAIKNMASKTAKAARLLHAEHRVALTGTPIENHLGELWSLFEFLNPGMLGRASRFRALLDPGTALATAEDDGFEREDGLSADDAEEERARYLEEVHAAVRPFLLRRHKEDVLNELPPKSVQTLTVELGETQRKHYNELRDHFRGQLLSGAQADERDDESVVGNGIQVLEALLRLRQIACHPALLDPARKVEDSAKLDTLFAHMDIVLEEDERKVLIFSQFTSFLDLVRPRVEERGIDYELLTGKTRDREARVRRFQDDPNCRVFLISLKAGGHGLNLTAADTVYLLDPWWNPAIEAQAIDRSHRHGQTRPVFAYRLIARGTVEEKVVALQARKQALSDALLGPERSLLGGLSRDELENLFS